MPAERTAHDLAQEANEQRRGYELEVVRLRQRLMRECPAGRALDRAHLAAMLAQQWSSTRPWLLARRFVLSGLVAEGHSDATIHAALGLDAAQVRAVLAEVLWWDPPASMLDDVPEEYRGAVIGAR